MGTGHVLRFEIPAAPEAVALARRRLLEELEGWGTPVDRDVALLLLSETVTNAILYGTDLTAADATIRIELAETEIALRVEVHDSHFDGIVRPANGHDHGDPACLRMSGRGLYLVEALAECWGVEREELGKYVYFELGNALDRRARQANGFDKQGGSEH
jgi:anti-sigma regulatory factor (Ser/Thr protein kinase)